MQLDIEAVRGGYILKVDGPEGPQEKEVHTNLESVIRRVAELVGYNTDWLTFRQPGEK